MLRFPRAFLAGASGSTYGLLVVVVAAGLTFRVVPALAESGVPGFANACDAPPVVACEGKSELVTCEGCGFTTCACLAHGCSLDGGARRAANVCFAIERCDATPASRSAPASARARRAKAPQRHRGACRAS